MVVLVLEEGENRLADITNSKNFSHVRKQFSQVEVQEARAS